MSFQGKHSSRVDEEIMEVLGLQLQKLPVRLSDKGFNLKWNNNEIISWYSAEGAKIKSKSKYKKIPAAIVYLLRRNDLATITENEKTITNIKEIERVRSDELQKLRKQVEVFAYEKQGWARQREEMATKVDHVQGKLITYSTYISALEDCCDKTGFPVAAVKQAALNETELETQTESEDDDTALACNIRPHRETRNRALVSLWPEKPSLRSPIKTRAKSNDSPKKAVKIAVLKTMTNADDEITTISRPLTCEECSRHKQVVGIMQRKGPFQPYWEALMLQANVYKLEIRDVWQIALLTIPEELRPKLNTEMKSGNIMNRVNDETDEGIYERLEQALLDMRGLSHAGWSKILEIKQAGNESFETYAERLWVTYREHSGLENADRNHDALLQLVKNNAGIPVQKALSNGVDPAENTLSGFLAQDHGGKLRPIAYYSRKKSTIEQGFDPCTQHVLAFHWMLTATEPIVGALQKPVIKLYHDYAHVSAPKTQQLIQKNFWWPQMASDRGIVIAL